MTRVFTQLLFACLLVLSQTALVSHDVTHMGAAHNELCAVYASQDHTADNLTVCTPPIFYLSPESLQVDAMDVFTLVSTPVYASRAPPKTVFFS